MNKFLAFALTVLITAPSQVPIPAADGDLDATFGIAGKVITDFSGGSDWAYDLAIQSDGKIVAAGAVSFPNYFGLARYNSDGSLDTTFGSGGKVTTDVSRNGDWANALAIQSDGKIVAAGLANWVDPDNGYPSSTVFGLARYNSDGSLDTTFGSGGIVTTDFKDGAYALAIQSDGKIVAAGLLGIARFNGDGSLDATFGSGGRVITGFPIWALTIQSDGKIVPAGAASYGPSYNPRSGFGLARYNGDGSLDTTFGIAGKADTDFLSWGAWVMDLAIQTDGKIIAAGWAGSDSFSDFAIVRYNRDGTLDTAFGRGGKVTTDFSGSGEFANALAIQSDGKIVAAGTGHVNHSVYPGFLLARYNSDGSLDAGFGAGGKLATDLPGGVSALGIQSDGKILTAGLALGSGDSDFALARYNNGGGLLFTDIRFDRSIVRVGGSWNATFSGPNLTDQTYFDVRFRSPVSNTDQVALNWQQGTSAQHSVPIGTPTGTWSVTGVRSHQNISDHSRDFVSVSTILTVTQIPF